MYVGYIYTLGETHGINIDSTVKKTLDNWYESNLKNFTSYIDTNAGFCGDRTPYLNTSGTVSGGGTGTTRTYYGAYIRLFKNDSISYAAPIFKCPESGTDLYTLSTSSKGNKALNKPIGLINADEVAYAGAVVGYSKNLSYFLYTKQNYWTISPTTASDAGIFYVDQDGHLGSYWVSASFGTRAVINLKADTQFSSGDGTASNPYVVS